jgi:manganese/zinc/iron transport system ATP- binding protein
MRDHPGPLGSSILPETGRNTAAIHAPPAVEVMDLTVAYDGSPVLYDVDVTLPPGQMVAVVGPNGAGKTTLLRSMLGLVHPSAGTIRLMGLPRAEARRMVAYVPQRASVDWEFPATVLDVALMGTYGRLGWFRRPGKKEREAARHALDRVGLGDLAHRPIGELSGGQQQRTFVARALVQDAPLVFLDEPFAGVDAVTEEAIVGVLRDLRSGGTTIVAVHHDLHTVVEYFDWVVLLNKQVVSAGPVETAYTEPHLRATFGGRMGALGSLVFGDAPLPARILESQDR